MIKEHQRQNGEEVPANRKRVEGLTENGKFKVCARTSLRGISHNEFMFLLIPGR